MRAVNNITQRLNRIGINPGKRKSLSTYWSQQTEVLFFGLYSEISGGQMPNKVTGATDYLTVAGSAGSETYQCPNTAPYIAADTDYIWFKTDETQRTTTTAELIGYDLQRTPVKYNDDSPYAIVAIMILKSGETITGTKLNRLFQDMWLHTLWDNNLNAYGHIKGNKLAQTLWTPEAVHEAEVLTYISGLATPLSAGQLTLLDNFVLSIKTGFSITNLDDAFDWMVFIGGETEESSLKNLVKNSFHCTKVNTPSWVAFEGMTPNGTDAYWNSNFRPHIDGIKYTVNNASFGCYIRTNVNEDKVDMGSSDTASGHMAMIITRYSGSAYVRINQDEVPLPTVLNGDSRGMWISNRLNSTDCDLFRNKLGIIDASNNSTVRPSIALKIGAFMYGTTLNSVASKQYAFAFAGRGLTQGEIDCLTDAVEVYMDANGKGVI